MNNLEQNETIILIGFSTIFQSRIGRFLADQLKVPFYDLNEEVEKLLQRIPPNETDSIGWNEITNVEKNVLANLILKKGSVIATSSDLVDDEENLNMLRYSDTAIIYLHGHFTETLAKYLATQLFSDKEMEQWAVDILKKIWESRDTSYRSIADLMIEISGKDAKEIAQEIAVFITTEVGENDLF